MSERVPALPDHIHLSAEFRLLAAVSWVAAPELLTFQADRIISICTKYHIDWQEFTVLVERHRVPVLAYIALQKHVAGCVPVEILSQLKELSTRSRMQALRHAAELVRVLKVFSAHGIEVIPLKGLLLSQQLYSDPCIRHSKDLDLMVRPEHVDLAGRLLKEHGYTNIFPGFELGERHKRYLSTAIHHFEYLHHETGLCVELHWRSFLWTPAQTEKMWLHSRREAWMGAQVNSLDSILQFLYLCDHGAGHKWFRLKWLSDIAMMVTQRGTVESAELVRAAGELDLTKTLVQTCLLVQWLYNINLSEPFATLIDEEKDAHVLAETALKELFFSEEKILSSGKRFESLRRVWYIMRLKPEMPRSIIMKSILISPVDLKMLPLPPRLFFLYIPLRPFLWFWRHYLVKSGKP